MGGQYHSRALGARFAVRESRFFGALLVFIKKSLALLRIASSGARPECGSSGGGDLRQKQTPHPFEGIRGSDRRRACTLRQALGLGRRSLLHSWLLSSSGWLLSSGGWLLSSGGWLLSSGGWLLGGNSLLHGWLLSSGGGLLGGNSLLHGWLLSSSGWFLSSGGWLLGSGGWLLGSGGWLLGSCCFLGLGCGGGCGLLRRHNMLLFFRCA